MDTLRALICSNWDNLRHQILADAVSAPMLKTGCCSAYAPAEWFLANVSLHGGERLNEELFSILQGYNQRATAHTIVLRYGCLRAHRVCCDKPIT